MVVQDGAEWRRRREAPSVVPLLLVGIGLVAVLGQVGFLVLVGSNPPLQTWTTVFVAIVLQAIPFLVLGVLLSATVSAWVSERDVSRWVPRRAGLAVPAAGLAGAALPGCECTSVPVAGRLVAAGVAESAALTFLLSAPAINPVVLVATAVAFPQSPTVVLARFLASLALALAMGWLWGLLGRPGWIRPPRRVHSHGGSRWNVFRLTAQHDFLQAGGFLVVGAMFSATVNVLVEPTWSSAVASVPVASVVVLGLLAVVLAICSEADAFVAASLSGFSSTAKLAFMVVGPAVDVKLIAMQLGTFGRGFVTRFVPATFVMALLLSAVAGWVLL